MQQLHFYKYAAILTDRIGLEDEQREEEEEEDNDDVIVVVVSRDNKQEARIKEK